MVEVLEDGFLFVFYASWQIHQFRQYSSLLCLYSTHNTSFALDDRSGKVYFDAIVVKNNVADCGISVAFMITLKQVCLLNSDHHG